MNRDRTAAVPEDLTGQPRRVPVGSGLRHTFRALRHRNYRLFFYGQLVSLIGTWMQQAALSWLVYQMTGSKFLLGVVAAAGSAPMMLFSMWGGSLADRHPKRTILLLTQTGSMLLAFALAFAVWLGKAEPWLILLIAAGNGAAMGFDMPARQSFLTDLTSREDLLNAVSLNSSIVNGARVVGPAVAGLALGHLGAAACFFLNGLSFLAVIAGLWRMRVSHHPAPAHAARRGHVAEGLRYAWHHVRVRTILALFAVVGIFGWSYSVLMPAFARDILGLGPDGYGALMAASGLGALFGALFVAAFGERVPVRIVALGGIWLFAVALAAFAFTRHFALALVFLWLSGAGLMLFFSTANTTLQTIVPDEMRGRVMGVWALVFGVMIPLGSLEVGMLSPLLGAPATIAFGAAVCALAAAGTWWIIRRREAQAARESSQSPRHTRAGMQPAERHNQQQRDLGGGL